MFKYVLAAALLAPVPALATERLPDVHVSYADLDLSSTAGRSKLDRRLAMAARQACPSIDTADLLMTAATKSCITSKIAKGRQDVRVMLASRGIAPQA